MENCELGSVEKYMYKKNRKEDIIRVIASCCLLGLDYLHSRNVIHGVIGYSDFNWIEHQTIESVIHGRWSCEAH